ncbi:MAG TPA: GreA/GreB family elongation factor [Methylotenera sp.]|nr:GreA/GreB family elongation factor [Methylotenera sp.]
MSRGFVKEDDLELAGTDLPERPISAQPNYVTVNGYAQLQQQAEALETSRLQLKANKDDASTQQKLAVVERDLRYVSARLESAILTTPNKSAEQVLFGATVKVEDEDGKLQQFTIVGEDEADIHLNKVSWVSPLAKALIGNKVGDVVNWPRPAGNTTLEIISIHYS